ncbi:MAG TPA: S-4TM family putative pore-forming effector [Ktedonobacteraceae bacterium]|nr:S-4TM family putative pore-forming effector [Ktedonobacteraceae bacterium]
MSVVLNDIAKKQNTQQQLERLAAQRYLYSRAKSVLGIQLALDLLSPLVLATIVAFVPSFDASAAFIGVVAGVTDLLLESYESSHKRRAADIQEIFDCDVLELECRDLQVRRRPITEIIMEAARDYKRSDPNYSDLRDWYPPTVEKIPLYLARLVCQRINCWWDSQLRRRYVGVVVIVLLLLCVSVFAIGLINGLTVAKLFLAVIFPLLPTFIWAYREIKGQTEAASEKDDLRKYAEELWEDAIHNKLPMEEIDKRSRNLQDEIYYNRRSNPFILDWFFKRLHYKNEEFVNRGAEELVKEALQCIGNKNNP